MLKATELWPFQHSLAHNSLPELPCVTARNKIIPFSRKLGKVKDYP
jgi:hypothetical protein